MSSWRSSLLTACLRPASPPLTRSRCHVYKTAKLANTFQWKLIELGYDKRIVQELTKELLLHTV